MKIISIDLGNTYGFCYKDDISEEWGQGTVVDLTDWGKQFGALLLLWKPDIVVLSQTNNFGFWNASRAMLMKAGVAFYICGKAGIPGVEFSDSQARKLVFGKALKKAEVQKFFPDMKKTPDALDALILARGWYILNKNQNDTETSI